jgi:hypothetical protein
MLETKTPHKTELFILLETTSTPSNYQLSSVQVAEMLISLLFGSFALFSLVGLVGLFGLFGLDGIVNPTFAYTPNIAMT